MTYLEKQSIKLPIYPGNLTIICSNSAKKVKKVLPEFSTSKIYGHTYFNVGNDNRSNFIIILDPTHKDFSDKGTGDIHSTIGHEAFHVSNFILSYIGHKSDIDNDEVQAYLIDFIIKTVNKFLLKHNFLEYA